MALILKIICFTDNLGSGGAQRQLTLLAILLKERGHRVNFVTYNSGEHFVPELKAAGISQTKLNRWPKWMRPAALRLLLHRLQPDGLIAFQEAPSFYAELACLGMKRLRLVVSERNSIPLTQTGKVLNLLIQFHRFADVVTTNSFARCHQMQSDLPTLKKRIVTVYNAVDLNRFKPAKSMAMESRLNKPLQFVVLSSHKAQKNFIGLAKAVKLIIDEPFIPRFKIDWYGDEAEPGWFARNQACCEQAGLSAIIYFHPATGAPEKVLGDADALILPSLWEGLPNAVCEALSSGCPVIMSNISDASFLVQEAVTGFLFDPISPKSGADAIRKFLFLPTTQRKFMRVKARKSAEKMFNPIHYVEAYETLLLGQDNQRCKPS